MEHLDGITKHRLPLASLPLTHHIKLLNLNHAHPLLFKLNPNLHKTIIHKPNPPPINNPNLLFFYGISPLLV